MILPGDVPPKAQGVFRDDKNIRAVEIASVTYVVGRYYVPSLWAGKRSWTIWRLNRLRSETLGQGIKRYVGWVSPVVTIHGDPPADTGEQYVSYLPDWIPADFTELLVVRARLDEFLRSIVRERGVNGDTSVVE